jgi:hypothetical protein
VFGISCVIRPAASLRELPASSRLAVIAIAVAVAVVTCAVFLYGIYPAYFNSDAAAHQILADAMLREGTLLPRDYTYNNQLILWRNQFGIALALKAGMSGYGAYVAGSLATFAICFAASFILIDGVLGNWGRSLAVTWLWLLPLGRAEAHYNLGQQTHLVWIVFVLAFAVHSWKVIQDSRRSTLICAAIAFAMMLEAPTRAAMVLVPFAAVIWLHSRGRLPLKSGAWVAFAAIAGWGVERWLAAGRMILGVPASSLSRFAQFADRSGELAGNFVDEFIGFFQFAGATSEPRFLALYALKAVVLVAFAGAIAFLVVRCARAAAAGPAESAANAFDFIGDCGAVHLLFGFWIVCAVEYGAVDVRHFLWGLMLVKLVIVVAAMQALSARVRPPALRAAVLVVSALLVCSTLTILFDASGRRMARTEATWHRPLYAALQARMHELGIRNVYGTYWVVQPAAVLVPNALTGPLTVEAGRAHFHSVLGPPSHRCAHGQVLYVFRGTSADQAVIAQQVVAAGGRLLDTFTEGRALYVGPAVWEQDGCA